MTCLAKADSNLRKTREGNPACAGIAGLIDFSKNTSSEQLCQMANSMGYAQRSRGPDGAGQWADPESGIGLDHRRLAIIDLD